MARQFLSAPASSACAERLFSSAGKMHDDLKKSTNEATLESQLIVNRNYPDA
jgi:2-oxo-4-hydroxy-4-carboxy--5-ureidoimidazoline (OHCU) decarboxylase